jgi:hypothetical protein
MFVKNLCRFAVVKTHVGKASLIWLARRLSSFLAISGRILRLILRMRVVGD